MNPDPEPPGDAAPTHDDLVKGLLSQLRLLVEFFRAFLPEVLEFADFSGAEYLDKEHGRTGKRPRRVGDLLVKAKWRGQDAVFLIHLESQAKAQRFALERVAEYALRDSIRYGLPVMPVLLLTLATARARAYALGGERIPARHANARQSIRRNRQARRP